MVAFVSLTKLPSDECHKTLLMISQHCCHYLSQWWPRSLSPYGVTRPQWVKVRCNSHCTHVSDFGEQLIFTDVTDFLTFVIFILLHLSIIRSQVSLLTLFRVSGQWINFKCIHFQITAQCFRFSWLIPPRLWIGVVHANNSYSESWVWLHWKTVAWQAYQLHPKFNSNTENTWSNMA